MRVSGLALQDDLTELAGLFEPAVRLGRIGQRERAVDDGRELPTEEELGRAEQFAFGAHIGPEYRICFANSTRRSMRPSSPVVAPQVVGVVVDRADARTRTTTSPGAGIGSGASS